MYFLMLIYRNILKKNSATYSFDKHRKRLSSRKNINLVIKIPDIYQNESTLMLILT